MTSSDCENFIQTTLRGMFNLRSVRADHITRILVITFPKGELEIDDLIETINSSGYSASDYEIRSQDERI